MRIVPPLLDDIANHVCMICNNKILKEAVYNMFLSRFASAIATKNILTDSVMHVKPLPLAYYGLNFASSGGGKNKPFMALGDLFTWLTDEYFTINERNKENFINKMKNRLSAEDFGNKKILKDIQQKADKLVKVKPSVNGSTAQKIYLIAEQIALNRYGSIFFYDTEFIKKFKEKKQRGNFDKTLDLIYNLYDGSVDFVDTVLTDRNEINNISCSACFSSDYSALKDDNKLRKDLKEYLLDGFARRIYVCFDNKKYKRSEHLSVKEIIEEKKLKQYYSSELKNIYDKVLANSIYFFSDNANEKIRNYSIAVDEYIDANYDKDILALEDDILKVELENSTWKIVKTAFLFHILSNPVAKEVQIESVEMAINYYKHFRQYLKTFLEIQDRDSLDDIQSQIGKYLDKKITLNDTFRKILKINYNDWKRYKTNNLKSVYDLLETNNIYAEESKEGKIEYVTFYKKEVN